MSFSQPDENLAKAVSRLKDGMGSAFDFKIFCDAIASGQEEADKRLREANDIVVVRQAQGESRVLRQQRHLIENAGDILRKLESRK